MSKKAINKLKVVPVEKNRSSKWLAERPGKNKATLSRSCTNNVQPPLKTFEIAGLLNIKLTDLLND